MTSPSVLFFPGSEMAPRRLLLASLWLHAASALISYSLSYHPIPSLLDIELSLSPELGGNRDFVMPRAVPSGYSLQTYERFVQNVTARSADGVTLAVRRSDGPRWSIDSSGSGIARLCYTVALKTMEGEILSAVDSSRVRNNYVSILGYSVFGWLDGLQDEAVRVKVNAPSGWSVLMTLNPTLPLPIETASGVARNFYALADSQIVLGSNRSFECLNLSMGAVRRDLNLFCTSLYSEESLGLDFALVRSLSVSAMQNVLRYFNSQPFESYTMVLELLRPLSSAHSYGFSMEHLNSSSINVAFGRGVTNSSDADLIQRFQYNLAHHFAHSWLPKRAHGPLYLPFEFEIGPVESDIWFNEVTRVVAPLLPISQYPVLVGICAIRCN